MPADARAALMRSPTSRKSGWGVTFGTLRCCVLADYSSTDYSQHRAGASAPVEWAAPGSEFRVVSKRDWFIGVVVLALGMLAHSAIPRYEWREGARSASPIGPVQQMIRIDRWTGQVEILRLPLR